MRIQATVWRNDTVTVEVVVAGRITSIVTTIGKDFLAGDRALVTNTLVYEVPDITTLILRILADQIPILLESTHRVTHGVGILTLDVWLGTIALAVAFALLVTYVHRTVDISLAVISATLILHRAGLVVSLDPIVSLFEVDAITTLITQAPYDDGRMIDERFDITLVALDMRYDILRELSERLLVISHTMRFQVCLGCDIQSVFIAEVVPARIIRIVTCTDSVYVELLHNLDVLNHALYANDISTIRINLMTVGTLDQYRLAIHQELGILDFYIAETYLLRNDLRYALLILQGDEYLIQIRSLCRPRLYIRHLDSTLGTYCLSYLLAILVTQGDGNIALATLKRNLIIQNTILEVILKTGIQTYISCMKLRTGIEIHLTGNTREAPIVLVFKIRTIAPAHHLHGNEVLTRLEILGDIELGSHLAVLAISHVLAVHPESQVTGG